MHGVCLHPGRAVIELKVRVYNRTPFVQTFLWWANVATRVHEGYQSFFPPDVHYVADHARRSMSAYPLAKGFYYGVDYGERGRTGIPSRRNSSTICSAALPDASRNAAGDNHSRLSPQRSLLLCEHPHAVQLHGHGQRRRFFRRVRLRRTGRHRPRRQPPHLTRQEAMDLGQSRIRLRLGSQSDRKGCERRIPSLHRNHELAYTPTTSPISVFSSPARPKRGASSGIPSRRSARHRMPIWMRPYPFASAAIRSQLRNNRSGGHARIPSARIILIAAVEN